MVQGLRVERIEACSTGEDRSLGNEFVLRLSVVWDCFRFQDLGMGLGYSHDGRVRCCASVVRTAF